MLPTDGPTDGQTLLQWAAGGGWGRPEAARHAQRGPVMLGGGQRLLVMPGIGSQYLEAAGGGL